MVVISAGNILNQTFSVWVKNLINYLILGIVAFAPLVGYTLFVVDDLRTPSDVITYSVIMGAGAFLLSNIVTGFVAFSVFRSLRNDPVGFGGMMTAGLSRIIPITGAGIGVGLAILLCVAPIFLFISSTGFGLLGIVMLVPAIYVAIMLALAVPVAAVEGVGVFTALKRSADLSKGSRGTIFGVLFIIGVFENILDRILNSIVGDPMLILWIALGTSAIFMTLSSVARAVAYHDIRTVKEGVNTADLASVFE
jgi:hypothetical protein